jgi:uncharacterized protein (TIGR03067 family)
LPPDEEAKIPEEQRYHMVFTGNWFATFQGSNRISASRFKVEPQHTPQRIFSDFDLGLAFGFKRVELVPTHGIYQITNGRLRLNFAIESEAMPTKFGAEHPEFRRVTGKLAQEQFHALKRHSSQAATTDAVGADEAVRKEARKVTEAHWGNWSAVSVAVVIREAGQGNALKRVNVDTKEARMTLDGEKMVRAGTGADGKPEQKATKVTFEEDKEPPRLTLHVKEGSKEWKIRYIYEVNGDTLRMCCFCNGNLDEAEAWPTKFSLDDDWENPKYPRLEVWKRVKEEDKNE